MNNPKPTSTKSIADGDGYVSMADGDGYVPDPDLASRGTSLRLEPAIAR